MQSVVRPLEDVWEAILEEAGGLSYSAKGIARLAPKLEALSRSYNLGLAEGRKTPLPVDARMAFSFPRDVPKGAGAVRELVRAWSPRESLRILDLGAGLGAMTWGAARAFGCPVEALLVDEDPAVLRGAEAIARSGGPSQLKLDLKTRTQPIAGLRDLGRHDLVFLGQVLSELDIEVEPAVRIEAHAALVTRVLEDFVAPDGALVIVEPALRDRTRHLHALRDRVLGRSDIHVFAPCLHRLGCPALAAEGDWCHEDLPIDLPPWVVPLARAAGLRWQGLTFSYLVLTKRAVAVVPAAYRFRVVSDLLRTKGKIELFACTTAGDRPKIRRLDRDAPQDDDRFAALRRGDVVTLAGAAGADDGDKPVDERGRVRGNATVAVDGDASRR